MSDSPPEPGYDREFNRALDRLISERRSIRRYRRDRVSPKDISAMVGSAAQMPSPSNRRPVRLIHIASPDKRGQIRREMENGLAFFREQADRADRPGRIKNVINHYWRFSEFMLNAPVLLAAGTVEETGGFSDRLVRAGIVGPAAAHTMDGDITIGIYLSALIHKARALGLGTCILTAPLVFMQNLDFLVPETGLSATFRARAFVTAGYADENPALPEKPAVEDILIPI